MAKSKLELAPAKGIRHFVFHACTVEQEGKTLTLNIPAAANLAWRGARVDKKGHPAWTKPQPLGAHEIYIACTGSAQTRRDGADYPQAKKIAGGTKIVFTGAASFGRVILGETSKLVVQANVKSISGLPAGTDWTGYESIELSGAPVEARSKPAPAKAKKGLELADGGTSGGGPHQPYP